MPPRTLLLLPPSEGKAAGGTGPAWHALPTAFPELCEARAAVVAAAGVGDTGPTLPTLSRFTGVLYAALGAGLATWWRPRLSPVLDGWVADAVVWDLLPAAYAAGWLPGQTWRARWRVRVLREAADGTWVTVSHDNKSTKGALARFVLARSPRSPADLLDWEMPAGYRVDRATSEYDASGGIVDVVRHSP